MIWLYGSPEAINSFKKMMAAYGENNNSQYRECLEAFIVFAREDVLKLYGQKKSAKIEYQFLTYNIDNSKFMNGFNRLSSWHNKSIQSTADAAAD
ncbi:hypothetical protein [Saccharospirillum impatiens]|uniref:hypothetical protein n=1 Tax=Saccharospirillum impatiens TaxID=169438 RepID=UPI00048E8068|nr:hypothetical protein [Saccharospirillum impatiens]